MSPSLFPPVGLSHFRSLHSILPFACNTTTTTREREVIFAASNGFWLKNFFQYCLCQYWITTRNEILSRRAASADSITDFYCTELLTQAQRICQQLRLFATDVVKCGLVSLIALIAASGRLWAGRKLNFWLARIFASITAFDRLLHSGHAQNYTYCYFCFIDWRTTCVLITLPLRAVRFVFHRTHFCGCRVPNVNKATVQLWQWVKFVSPLAH
jgi:hypothetical protein